MFLHVAISVQFIAGVEEFLVVSFADQFIQFVFCQAFLVEIARVEAYFFFQQETSCFAASGSSRLLIKGNLSWHLKPLSIPFWNERLVAWNCRVDLE